MGIQIQIILFQQFTFLYNHVLKIRIFLSCVQLCVDFLMSPPDNLYILLEAIMRQFHSHDQQNSYQSYKFPSFWLSELYASSSVNLNKVLTKCESICLFIIINIANKFARAFSICWNYPYDKTFLPMT